MNSVKSPNKQQLVPLAVFTILYMLASIVVAKLAGNGEFVFYIVVMVVLIGAVGLVHRKVGLSLGVLWALSIWGLLHMAGGLVPVPQTWPYEGENAVLYSLWLLPQKLKYDQLVHAYGFGVTTWVCWQGLRKSWRTPEGSIPKPTLGAMTLCVAAGMGFGAFNEVVEFIATLTLPSTNVGGYENTGWDLVSNLIGCLIAAFLIRWGTPQNS